MLRRSLLARSAVVLTVVGFTPVPAAAVAQPTASPATAVAASTVAALQTATRTGGNRRGQASEPRTGPEVQAEAEAVLAATGIGCQVTNAVSPGQQGRINIYEVSCANGLGHILTDGEQPLARNCIIAAQQDQEARAADPNAPAQVTCQLPENQGFQDVMNGYVQSAGITCQVDQTAWIGRTSEGEERYEVGCAGQDGYWLRVNNAGEYQGKLECVEVLSGGGECRFTTAEEQLATYGSRFASVAPQACTPEQGRYVGGNEQSRFYEVKCAEGFGFIGQTDVEGNAVSARDCSRPQLVQGGCTLTDATAAMAAAGEQRAASLAQIGRACTVSQERIVAVENPPDGTPGREIYELDCAEQPLGLMGFFPVAGGSGEVEAYDCFTMDSRGLECQFTSRDDIIATLNTMIAAGNRNCDVSDFRVVARMAETPGDVAEVKCSDGRGWFGEFPDERQVTGQLIPCSAAARQGDDCVL